MKFFQYVASVSFLLFSVGANASIINVFSNVQPNTQTLSLLAGTYNVNAIGVADGGLYNAWNAWGTTGGCDVNGANCSAGGFLHYYTIEAAELGVVNVGSTSVANRYATSLLALDNASDYSFTLTSAADVNFSIYDNCCDNLGGVSLDVVAVPEPVTTGLLGSALFGLIGATRLRKRPNVV